MTLHDNPLQFILRILYGLGFAVVVIGVIGFFGYRAYKKKKAPKPEAADEAAKPPESGT